MSVASLNFKRLAPNKNIFRLLEKCHIKSKITSL